MGETRVFKRVTVVLLAVLFWTPSRADEAQISFFAGTPVASAGWDALCNWPDGEPDDPVSNPFVRNCGKTAARQASTARRAPACVKNCSGSASQCLTSSRGRNDRVTTYFIYAEACVLR